MKYYGSRTFKYKHQNGKMENRKKHEEYLI